MEKASVILMTIAAVAGTGKRRVLLMVVHHFRPPQLLLHHGDVVAREAERLDFREFGVFRRGRENDAEFVERVVQAVHPVTLAVVGFDAADLFHLLYEARATAAGSGFAVTLAGGFFGGLGGGIFAGRVGVWLGHRGVERRGEEGGFRFYGGKWLRCHAAGHGQR